ncbi:putative rubber elongation factor [Helianthus annuus]|nr:putative rubber elongation factor [Helianthus annuus]
MICCRFRSDLAQRDGGEEHLKYLDFVQNAVIYFVVCFSTVYGYAKENAGSLKPGVQTVENTVRTVVGPVYEKYHELPLEALKFLDLKVCLLV